MKRTTTPKSERRFVLKSAAVKRRPGDLDRLRTRSRAPVDLSDGPPIAQADLDAGRVRIIRRQPAGRKVSLSIRLDEDIVAWFKSQGDGYQTRINDALRAHRAAVDTGSPSDAAKALDQIEALLTLVRRKVS